MSNAKPFIFLLLVAVMLCCNGAWALEGTRDGKYIDGISQDGCEYSLYESYSYTYEETKRSFTGRCAVLTKFKSEGACIPSTVTCDGYEYPVVALGERCYNENEQSLPSSVSIPNTVEVIEAFAFDKGDNSLVGITLEDGDKVLFCYRSSNGTFHNGTFSWNECSENGLYRT